MVRREITSDSEKTVHMLFILAGLALLSESSPIFATRTCSTRAITSMNLPVPAAHLSFITKFATWPSSVRLIALLSWPPMSRIVLAEGQTAFAPSAWAVISVTDLLASLNTFRP